MKNNSTTQTHSLELDIYQSTWGMIDLPSRDKTWSMDEQLQQIAAAGFQGIQHTLEPGDTAVPLLPSLARHNLKFGANCTVKSVEEFEPLATLAKASGAPYINVMVKDYFVVGHEAIDLLRRIHECAATQDIQLFIETHRGTITQDLLRTISYLDDLPGLNLTLDFSHYVVSGEIYDTNGKVESAFWKLIERVGSIHGRISNGNQVQISIEPYHEREIELFSAWWLKAMQTWLLQTVPGSRLPFVVELGPPSYAIVDYNASIKGTQVEASDRWVEALKLKALALSLWQKASARN